MRPIILTALIGLAACGGGVSSLGQAGDIKVVADKDVAACEILGDIHGFNIWGGIWAAPGFRQARDNAIAEAEGLGATHVVWIESQEAVLSQTHEIHGMAYRCPE